MRTSPKRLAIGGALIAVLGAAPLANVLIARSQADAASRAILYLQSQQSATTGAIPSSPGSYGPSELYAISAAAAGYDPNAMRSANGPSVMDFLAANVVDASSSAAQCGELVQAVVAAGGDAHAFARHDLVATLLSTLIPSTGAFGDGQAFTQALAVQGLVAASSPVPQQALSYLMNSQNSDGGWDYLNIRNDPNPKDFATSDTNSTAMSLMALDAAGNHSRDATALAWLRSQLNSDGGFPYQTGSPSDPDSTALVVQAIAATGGDPSSATWSSAGRTPLDELRATQDANGGYTFPGKTSPDAFTTSQVPLALLQQPLPAHGVYTRGFATTSEARSALRSLQYLEAQQLAGDGSLSGITATYDPMELFVIGAAAAGYDPTTLRNGGPSAVDYLQAHTHAACASAGQCGRLIQAVAAANLDPHAFGGLNLVATLQGFYNASTGAFGDGQAFTQALAIQGLVAAGAAVPTPAMVFLAAAQDSDGGWNYLDIKDDPNPKDFATSDTNSTAMGLMALDAAGNHTRDAAALHWLQTQQSATGGFAYQAGTPADPDSTALVLQAIVATGGDVTAPWWSRGGATAVSALVSMQAGNGGYVFPGNTAPDAFTTAQVPVALERVAFPVPFKTRAFYQPGTSLGASASSPGGPTGSVSSSGRAGVVTNGGYSPGFRVGAANNGAGTTASSNASTATPAPSPGSGTQAPSSPPPRGPHVIGTSQTPQLGFPVWVVYLLVVVAAAALAAGAGTLALRMR
jgi:prenyltransferase beta subunit